MKNNKTVSRTSVLAIKKPDLLTEGDRIKFSEEKQMYIVQATSARYSVCTKPFNPKKTVLYSIIDWEDQIRGTENLIFGAGAETQESCFQMLVRLMDGDTAISRRNYIPLSVEKIVTSLGEALTLPTKEVE